MMIISSYNELTGEDEIPHFVLNGVSDRYP